VVAAAVCTGHNRCSHPMRGHKVLVIDLADGVDTPPHMRKRIVLQEFQPVDCIGEHIEPSWWRDLLPVQETVPAPSILNSFERAVLFLKPNLERAHCCRR